jgi:hypothetical protein
MINNFHIQVQSHYNPKDDHNPLTIPRDVVITTQLQIYKNLCNITKQGDVHSTFLKGRIPLLTRPCHSTPKKVRMTAHHLI